MKKKTIIVIMLSVIIFAAGAGYVNSINPAIKTYGAAVVTGPFRPCNALNDKENVYFTVYNTDTGQGWDENAGDFIDTDDAQITGGNYGNVAISATDLRAQIEDGWMPNMPATMHTKDSNFECDVKFYDNATPAVGDAILFGRHCFVKSIMINGVLKSRIYAYYDL
jgi:hypothetical protein